MTPGPETRSKGERVATPSPDVQGQLWALYHETYPCWRYLGGGKFSLDPLWDAESARPAEREKP